MSIENKQKSPQKRPQNHPQKAQIYLHQSSTPFQIINMLTDTSHSAKNQ